MRRSIWIDSVTKTELLQIQAHHLIHLGVSLSFAQVVRAAVTSLHNKLGLPPVPLTPKEPTNAH